MNLMPWLGSFSWFLFFFVTLIIIPCCKSCIHDVDGVMVVGASEPVLQHVSSHRLRPSAPYSTHRGDLSAGPAGRDSEVRMPWVSG